MFFKTHGFLFVRSLCCSHICSMYYVKYCDAQCKCKTIGDWFINLILSCAIFYFVYIILQYLHLLFLFRQPSWSWSWSYGSWIYNYLCNQCLSPLTFWIRIPLRRGVLDITLCDQVCQWLATGRWFSPGTPVSSTNETDRHDITEIVLKVALSIFTLTYLQLRIMVFTMIPCHLYL